MIGPYPLTYTRDGDGGVLSLAGDGGLSYFGSVSYGCRNYADEVVKRHNAYKANQELILRLSGQLSEAHEVLREGAVSLENSLKRITLIDGGITDENEELYYLGIAALDNMTDLDPTTYTLTDRGRAALEATR
jgi:hypothetical protein